MTQILTRAPRLDSTTALGDTCDCCGVPAKLQVELAAGGELTFCGHHANRLARQIAVEAVHVVVEDGFEWRGLALYPS